MPKEYFTAHQLKELQQKGLIKGVIEQPTNESKTKKSTKSIKEKPAKKKGDSALHKFVQKKLTERNIRFTKEYLFAQPRKFRFDFYLPDYNCGIEVEGIMSFKTNKERKYSKNGVDITDKARHTTVTGYSMDCVKYNLASLKGYKLIRLTVIIQNELDTFLDLLLPTT